MKAIAFLNILFCLFILSCDSQKSGSTTLDSDDFSDKSRRIAALKKEIKAFSEFNDAEFHLINANGFSDQRNSVPGASSWFYQFVVKVDTNDVYRWTGELIEIPAYNSTPDWPDIIPASRKQNWQVHSAPTAFTRKDSNVTVLVYKTEGIVYKKIINN